MTMPRPSVYPVLRPAHSRLPAAGEAVWYPTHGSLDPGLDGLPAMTQLGSSHVGSPYATVGLYTFPTDNATAAIGAAHDDDSDLLDQGMTMANMASGNTFYATIEASWVDQATAAGEFWSYGANSAASLLSLAITTGDVPSLMIRGRNASTATSVTTSWVSGKTLPDFKNGGRMVAAVEIKATGAMTADATIMFGKVGTGWTGLYTANGIDFSANGGTHPPGRYEAAIHPGLMLGGRWSATTTVERTFGRGSGNTGRVGNFVFRRYPTFTTGKLTNVLLGAVARPSDFPPDLLNP